jgi:hypothetical protein
LKREIQGWEREI